MIFTGHTGRKEMEVAEAFDGDGDLCFDIYFADDTNDRAAVYLPRATAERLRKHLDAVLGAPAGGHQGRSA